MNNILQHRHGVVRKHKYKHKKAYSEGGGLYVSVSLYLCLRAYTKAIGKHQLTKEQVLLQNICSMSG